MHSLQQLCLTEGSEVSDSEDDPSLPLPPDSHARDICICQGPYQPRLSKYKVTVHRGKGRSFCGQTMMPVQTYQVKQNLKNHRRPLLQGVETRVNQSSTL